MDFKKLMFWKKDDLDFGDLDKAPSPESPLGLGKSSDSFNPNLGLGGLQQPSQQPSYPSFQAFQQPQQQMQSQFQQPYQQSQSMMSKDIELIASKLDAIRLSIDNLSQRLANLERMVYGEIQQQQSQVYQQMPPRTY
ncbi:hypothetical protein KY320_00290 [Candidatus Woesearchaeota archaeon]|nr:hypothetical protein [Candidatus Woesearchaeota archaeon]